MTEEQLFGHAMIDVRIQAYPQKPNTDREYKVEIQKDEVNVSVFLCLIEGDEIRGRYRVYIDIDHPYTRVKAKEIQVKLRNYITKLGLTHRF